MCSAVRSGWRIQKVAVNDIDKAALRRRLLRVAQIALVLAILGLLAAIWLPVWIGPHPGAPR
jgi:hypothetical protein